MKKQHWVLLVVIILLAGASFYWFQWRPTQIRKECFETSVRSPLNEPTNNLTERKQAQDYVYTNCLKDNGLTK